MHFPVVTVSSNYSPINCMEASSPQDHLTSYCVPYNLRTRSINVGTVVKPDDLPKILQDTASFRRLGTYTIFINMYLPLFNQVIIPGENQSSNCQSDACLLSLGHELRSMMSLKAYCSDSTKTPHMIIRLLSADETVQFICQAIFASIKPTY